MILYKLTDQEGKTKHNTQWGPGISHEATGDTNQPLCSDAWIHAYESTELAILMNPIHGRFDNPKLWQAEGEIRISDGTKCGCRELKTIKELDIPEITLEQKVKFGILTTLEVYKEENFLIWSNNWLSGKDRSYAATNAANAAAYDAAYAADANADAYAADAAAYDAYAANANADAAITINFVEIAKQCLL